MSGARILEDRFVLDDAAASGGAGTVYRARDSATGERVAVKLLAATDQLDVGRFAREAAALAKLSHANIVRYIAGGQAGDQHYLVMEWIEGENLAERLATTGLTTRETVIVARQIASALAEAHRHGVVHRDVKPENVMLQDGSLERVRVVDFGLARFVGDDQRLTHTGMAMGTPGYMSPEQARGERELDGRTDVFALGCILYEALTAWPPFCGENVMALQIKVLLVEPPPLPDELPPALSALVSRMLVKDLAARPTMAEVADALAALTALPDDARRIAGTPAAQTRKLAAVDRSPARWLVTAAPRKPVADWSSRVTAAAARWPHELTRDQVVVIGQPSAEAAATCALELARALADATVVVSAPAPLRATAEETIDRSTRLMTVAALRALFARGKANAQIYLDAVTAKLLPPPFEVVADGDAFFLRDPRS